MCRHVGRLLSVEFFNLFFGESDVAGRSDPALVLQYLAALGAAFRCSGDERSGGLVNSEQDCSCGYALSLGYGLDGSKVRRCGLPLLERSDGGTPARSDGEPVGSFGTNIGADDSVAQCGVCKGWTGHAVRRLVGDSDEVGCCGRASKSTGNQDLPSRGVLGASSGGKMVHDSPNYGVDERLHVASRSELLCGFYADNVRERETGDVGVEIDRPEESASAEVCHVRLCDGSAEVREDGVATVFRGVNDSARKNVAELSCSVEGSSLVSEKTKLNREKRVKARDRKKRKQANQANQRVSPRLPAEKMSWRQSSVPSKEKKNPELSVSVSAVDAAKESLARVWLLRNKREEAKLLREEIAGGDESGAHVARLAALDREEQAAAIERRIVENQVKKAKADHELKVLQARNLVISVEKDRVAQLAAVERGRVSVEKAHATLKSSGSSSFAETLLSGSSGSVSPNSSISQQELLNLEKTKLDLERENDENKDVIKDLVALVRSTDGAEVANRVKVYMKKKEKALSWLTLDEHGSVDQGEIDKRFPSGWDAIVHEDIGKVHIESAYGVTQLSGGKYERVAYGAPEVGSGKEDDDVSDASALTGDNLVKRLRDLELMLAR